MILDVTMRLAAVSVLIALLGCAPSAQSPDPTPTSSIARSPVPQPSLVPSLNPSLPLPSGFVLPPIVDPDGASPPYQRDEPVQAGGVTVVYRGTIQAEGRYVTRFDVTGPLQSPPGALFFLPNGPSVGLEVTAAGVESEPFRLAAVPDPSTLFAWLVGSETLVWELGPVSD